MALWYGKRGFFVLSVKVFFFARYENDLRSSFFAWEELYLSCLPQWSETELFLRIPMKPDREFAAAGGRSGFQEGSVIFLFF